MYTFCAKLEFHEIPLANASARILNVADFFYRDYSFIWGKNFDFDVGKLTIDIFNQSQTFKIL